MNDQLPGGLGGRFGNISDLPDELRQQIAAVRVDELEQKILQLMSGFFDGAATVDEVLVGLYRLTGKVYDRRKIAGKLYRMVNSTPPLLRSVEKKRGVYRIP